MEVVLQAYVLGIINNWTDHVTATNTATRTLAAGDHTIRMHFYERMGVAEARLSWTGSTPPPPPPPNVSLSAAPLSVQSGGSSTLTWSSTGATSCTASGGWSGSKALAGTETQTSLTTTQTYTLACTGAGGSATRSTTVTVGTPPPFTPNPALNIPANAAKDLGVFTCNQPTDSPAGCDYVTDYSGFVYDPFFHRMLMFGGGHGPAQATTIYAFNPNTLAWTALYQSTLMGDMTPANKDGQKGAWMNTQQPIVRHSYDMLVVGDWGGSLGKRLVMMTGGGMDEAYGIFNTRIAHYDLTRVPTGSYTQDGRWTFANTSAHGPWYYAAASALDPVSKKVLVFGPNNQAGAGGLWVYDPVTDSPVPSQPVVYQPQPWLLSADHMVYFPPNDKFYYFRMHGAPRVLEITFDRANPANSTIVDVATTGTGPSSNNETGYAYDSRNQLIGGAVENGNFHAYNPLTKAWTRRAMQPMSGGPIGDVAFHALDYDPVNNVYIILTESRRTWAYRWQ